MNKEENIQALLKKIQDSEGSGFIVQEDAIFEEVQKAGADKSTLAIKVMSIFGGFFATMAFLGFIAISGVYNSEFGLIVLGLGFVVAAIAVNKKYDKLVIDTAALSVFISGFILFGIGLSESKVDENTICLLYILLACCSLFVTQNYLLSFISVLIISSSILFLLVSQDMHNFVQLYVVMFEVLLTYWMLNEARIITAHKKLSRLYNPIRMGLVISVVIGLVFVGIKGLAPKPLDHIWLSSIFSIALILFILSLLLNQINRKEPKEQMAAYCIGFLVLLPTVISPAISGSILIVLLCFLVCAETGFVLGIISLLYFVSQYYYDLSFTLLVKSGILFSTGVMFILLYLFIERKFGTDDKS